MKIYTRTGDTGDTGLIGGARAPKDSLRIAAIGEVDELNAALGMARVHLQDDPLDQELETIQCRLFDLGAHLASPNRTPVTRVGSDDVDALERSIDRMTDRLAPLRAFILPGGSPAGAAMHFARTVCRRAERAVLGLHRCDPVDEVALAFLNRLSDWLFVAARTANADRHVSDVEWHPKEDI